MPTLLLQKAMKNKFISFKNMNFRKKMMIVYIISIFFPMLIIGTFYCVSIRNHIKKNNIDEITFDVDVTADAVERVIDHVRMLSDEIYYDNVLRNNLTMDGGSIQELIDNADEINNIDRYCMIYDFIESVKIYTYNDKLYRSGTLFKISDIKSNEEWYRRFNETGNEYAVISYYDSSIGKSRISIVRRLTYNGRSNDILKIDISYAAVANELTYNENKGWFYLFNEDNICISESGENHEKKNLGLPLSLSGKNVIKKSLSMPMGYTLCCEYENDYMNDIKSEMIIFFILTVATMLISAFFVYIITCSMLNKMAELTKASEELLHGNFVEVSAENMGDDEIGKLTRGFNAAISKIDILIHEVYEEKLKSEKIEKEKSQAEFIALQRQVNPHFLFNILEILRMKCVTSGNKEIADMIRNLSVMLRCQINWKQDIIPFENEFSLIQAFIGIHKCNFDGELTTYIEVEEEIKKCMIPKMSAQIFVENAFRHGLDSLSRNRIFKFRAYHSGDTLTIVISDNGKGMEKKLVDAINSGDIDRIKTESGDGISNVFERLGLYYGTDFNISAESIPFEKTEIVMRIPFGTQ